MSESEPNSVNVQGNELPYHADYLCYERDPRPGSFGPAVYRGAKPGTWYWQWSLPGETTDSSRGFATPQEAADDLSAWLHRDKEEDSHGKP